MPPQRPSVIVFDAFPNQNRRRSHTQTTTSVHSTAWLFRARSHPSAGPHVWNIQNHAVSINSIHKNMKKCSYIITGWWWAGWRDCGCTGEYLFLLSLCRSPAQTVISIKTNTNHTQGNVENKIHLQIHVVIVHVHGPGELDASGQVHIDIDVVDAQVC